MGFMNYAMLANGIDDANKHLREMCDGEQLVRINQDYTWIYAPDTNPLTYTAKDGAPQDAIDFAERVCLNGSYNHDWRITASSDDPPYRGWPTQKLW